MSRSYLPVQRDQMRIPLTIRQSVRADHPVWVVIILMEDVLDLSALHTGAKLGGPGRPPYNPTTLATLLVWGQLLGTQSCRAITLQCETDLALQAICGEHIPSEDTLNSFRRQFLSHIDDIGTQVLQLLALAGMGDFTETAIDGVKLGANASKKANHDEDRLRKLLTALDTQLAEHGEHLTAQQRTGLTAQRVRLRQALDELVTQREEEERHERETGQAWLDAQAEAARRGRPPTQVAVAAAELSLDRVIAKRRAAHADWSARNAAAVAAGAKGLPGTAPKVGEHPKVIAAAARVHRERALARAAAEQKATARPVRNTTDPDSRLLPVRGGGFVQGYNCQAATTRDNVIAAGLTTQDTGDVRQAQAMLLAVAAARDLVERTRRAAGWSCTCPPAADQPAPTGQATTSVDADRRRRADAARACLVHHGLVIVWVLLDAGYLSTDNITADGPPRLIAIGKHRDQVSAAAQAPTQGLPDPDASPVQQMAHLLRTPEGAAAYRQRGPIAERPFAQLKHNRNIDTLHTRGLPQASNEWTFLRTSHNLRLLVDRIRGDRAVLPGLTADFHRARAALATATPAPCQPPAGAPGPTPPRHGQLTIEDLGVSLPQPRAA
jgi:transposase